MYKNRFNKRENSRKIFGKKSQPKSLANSELIKAIETVEIIKKNNTQNAKKSHTSEKDFGIFRVSPLVLKNIADKGYTTPTPIQQQAIPAITAGHDVIGIANTGTGKTAAFLIPLVSKVVYNKSEKILIITPTRELAMQIYDELLSFSKGLGIYTAVCIGGVSIHRQKIDLRQNPHFVIGTPGRIKDLIQEKCIFLSTFHTIVLDETDRMVDIGFIKDIKYFISLLPQNRQSLFFSATVSPKVKEILYQFVKNPITLSVNQYETMENIEQSVVKVEFGYKKVDKLHDLLAQKGFDKVLLFGKTKWGIQKLANELIRRGFRAGSIHGNKNQNQRQRVLQQFKNNEIQILLATDVASRGLDIPDVTHVINYDMPSSMEDYIHRIGRTGRANKIGLALTFIENNQ